MFTQTPNAPKNPSGAKSQTLSLFPFTKTKAKTKPSASRRFAVTTTQTIRAFESWQEASRYIDLRLAKKPFYRFSIQQTQAGWIVSRVVGGVA